MKKQKLSESLCQKITGIVEAYIQKYPTEWENFRKQQKLIRNNLKTKWAEVNGYQGVVIREIMQMPETLFALFKVGLSDEEYLEFQEEKYKFWLANTFPDFKTIEGRL